MAKSDLLKEAIADAKAVKETALANAKIALEEAFAPRIQSMLSAKLAEEEMEAEEEMMAPEAPVEEHEVMYQDDALAEIYNSRWVPGASYRPKLWIMTGQ